MIVATDDDDCYCCGSPFHCPEYTEEKREEKRRVEEGLPL
jgi:hypothetical protein